MTERNLTAQSWVKEQIKRFKENGTFSIDDENRYSSEVVLHYAIEQKANFLLPYFKEDLYTHTFLKYIMKTDINMLSDIPKNVRANEEIMEDLMTFNANVSPYWTGSKEVLKKILLRLFKRNTGYLKYFPEFFEEFSDKELIAKNPSVIYRLHYLKREQTKELVEYAVECGLKLFSDAINRFELNVNSCEMIIDIDPRNYIIFNTENQKNPDVIFYLLNKIMKDKYGKHPMGAINRENILKVVEDVFLFDMKRKCDVWEMANKLEVVDKELFLVFAKHPALKETMSRLKINVRNIEQGNEYKNFMKMMTLKISLASEDKVEKPKSKIKKI